MLGGLTATLAAATLVGAAPATAAPAPAAPAGTRFYVPEPNPDAVEQVADLRADGRRTEANLIQKVLDTPTAVWVEDGTPREVQRSVQRTMRDAAAQRAVPVLVLYNIPFRDCAQYSAGGATSVEEYEAWVDAVARGIGGREAVVAVEPDGLGIIPWYTTLDGQQDWCQPAEADAQTAAAERFRMLNHAVDQLTALPRTKVYLDGTHDGWLGVGEITDRLVKAGVERADGFFVNASNYRWTDRLVRYGRWISQCAYLVERRDVDPRTCASQYYPADPSDVSTWDRTDAAYEAAYEAAGLSMRPRQMAHFIVDTSRNGQGPWTPPAGAFPDPQDWCNPPGRGVGLRPTTRTGDPLVDAYVWIKVPGESDGQCSRGTGTGNDVVDPVWRQVDPAAGQWFRRQAVELVRLAVPSLRGDQG
ncbi:glycoside hydrolase family 6 [Vallicoccus soli]|uniref:Glucanase n=1 Tax=Vallicoccus soli TaxID=2339232 RepID=A0A3A3YY91_9ACTN|nr:glycoside hydrolase family 6 [Vallicoccus soli]